MMLYEKAKEAWEKLDLSNQSNLEAARTWFEEGFAHGYESAQTKTPEKDE